jgi:hypothetical protein
MLQFAGPVLLALAFAITLESRVADAAMISVDLYPSEFCAGCAPLLDDTIKTEINWPICLGNTTQSPSAYKYNSEPDCENFGEIFAAETATEIVKSINDHLGSETLDSTAPIRLIPLSQVDQYLGLVGRSRNGAEPDFFGRC